MRVSNIDGKADVQSFDKPKWIKTFSDLGEHFAYRIHEKYQIHIVFGRYDLPLSLKDAIRLKNKLLSHVKKKELTVYRDGSRVVVAWDCE